MPLVNRYTGTVLYCTIPYMEYRTPGTGQYGFKKSLSVDIEKGCFFCLKGVERLVNDHVLRYSTVQIQYILVTFKHLKCTELYSTWPGPNGELTQ